MSRDASVFDIFSDYNPNSKFAFSVWKRYKIKKFLSSIVEASFSGGLYDYIKLPKYNSAFLKDWLKDDDFIVLLAFCRLINQHPESAVQFFSEFQNQFYLSDQKKALQIAEKIYSIISNKLHEYVDLSSRNQSPAENKDKPPDKSSSTREGSSAQEEHNNNNDNNNVAVVPKAAIPVKRIKNSGKRFAWGFEDTSKIQERVSETYRGFFDGTGSRENCEFASDTLQSLMHQRMRKEHLAAEAKRFIGYVFAAIFGVLALGALILGVLYTGGLILVPWVILAAVGGGAAFTSAGLAVASTPSIVNKICSFFCVKKRQDKSKLEAFKTCRPRELII